MSELAHSGDPSFGVFVERFLSSTVYLKKDFTCIKKSLFPNFQHPRKISLSLSFAKASEERRYCPEILNQLRAIRSAIKSVELRILDTHLSSCVTEACLSQDQNEQRKKIDEIRELIKRFE